MEKDHLVLERASASRPSEEWNEYDVLADDTVVGRIVKANASPVGASRKPRSAGPVTAFYAASLP